MPNLLSQLPEPCIFCYQLDSVTVHRVSFIPVKTHRHRHWGILGLPGASFGRQLATDALRLYTPIVSPLSDCLAVYDEVWSDEAAACSVPHLHCCLPGKEEE